MRSHRRSSSGRSLEASRIAAPPSARARIVAWISALAPTSTPAVGSSSSSRRGWLAQRARQQQPSAGCRPTASRSAPRCRPRGSPRRRDPRRASDGVPPPGAGASRRRGQEDVLAHAEASGSAPCGRGPRRRSTGRRRARDRAGARGRRRPATLSSISLRPAPTRPARPTISPARTCERRRRARGRPLRPATRSTGSPSGAARAARRQRSRGRPCARTSVRRRRPPPPSVATRGGRRAAR